MPDQHMEHCLWLTPSVDAPRSGARRFADLMRDRCSVVVKELEVWRLATDGAYDL
jgi:hypothetical protein